MMSITNENSVLQEDLDYIAHSDIRFDTLNKCSVLITGATGLIGVFLIRTILNINRVRNINIKVIALARNEAKAESIWGTLEEHHGLTFVYADICNKITVDEPVDYIIHCASITSSKVMICKPVETILTSVEGTKNILNLAVEKKSKSVVYVSSMEVYGVFEKKNNNVLEDNMGYINPLNIRSNYPESKRLCENMCIAYLKEYTVPVKIARLAQTFGSGLLPGENRIFAQFAESVIMGKDIVLHTKGISEGNYCYIRDTVKALLILLIAGENGEAYNISNPNSHTSIADMAMLVSEKIANKKIEVKFDIQESNTYGYASDTKMKLNSDKICKLGWKPEVDLEESYRRLIKSMEESMEHEMYGR